MASALPPSPVKHGKLKVLECERKMGVWWPRGLRRRGGRNAFQVIRDLNAGLQKVIEKYCKNEPNAALPLAELEASANEVFDSIGPRMWPTPEADAEGGRFQWLANAWENDLEGLYPLDLYYAHDEDRPLLRRHFNDMVVARCIIYNKNHSRTSQNDRMHNERLISAPSALPSGEGEQDEGEQDEGEQDEGEQDEGGQYEDDRYDTTYRTRRSTRVSGTALTVPTSDADYDTRSRGGAEKRRGSTLEANNAKRQHDSRLRRLPPWSLVIVLKLSPQSLLAWTKANEAGPQVDETSNPSTDTSRSAAHGQSELASDPDVLERQHRERARAGLRRWTSSTATAMGEAGPTEMLASVEYSDSLAAANRRGREEAKRARALRDSGMSRNTIEVLDVRNSDDPAPVATQRRSLSGAEGKSEKRMYDHDDSTARSVDGSCLEDTLGLQRRLDPVIFAPSVSNGPLSKSRIQAPSNSQAGTRSGPTGPPSPAESQPGPSSPVASKSDPQPATSLDDSGGTHENDAMATLERIDTEIDWTPLDKFPSSIPLQVCRTIEDFFAQIDDSRPQVLKQRRVHAAQIEHHNYRGAGQNVTCRIFREGLKGSLAFEKMLGRLKHYDGETLPMLKITVEWSP
ncbi:hypothetical protein LTS09_000920 [Friedmanniomyces endolithicus]|nr:hypothetical protein LTS09_000920 [Friedmanniomyces endolithicus]